MQETSGFLRGNGGVRLFYRTWAPAEPIGTVVLAPGTNEHTGRYRHVAEFFAQRGMAVHALDHRGYGQSEGARCYVDSFNDYLQDLRLFVEMAGRGTKPILIGHSLGGLIAYRYGVAYPETLRAVVLSSPFFALKMKVSPIQQALAPVLSRLLPRLQLSAGILPENVCRDSAVVKAYATDPLVGTKATPRWFVECDRAGRESLHGLKAGLQLPALFLQAGDDRLVDPEATRAVYGLVAHDRKEFKLYPGKYHEIFNDPGYEEVFTDIWNWLQTHRLVELGR